MQASRTSVCLRAAWSRQPRSACKCLNLAMHCRAAKNEKFQETFIAKNGKDRPKARLSWYHPDDTVSAACHYLSSPQARLIHWHPRRAQQGQEECPRTAFARCRSLLTGSKQYTQAATLHPVCVFRAWQGNNCTLACSFGTSGARYCPLLCAGETFHLPSTALYICCPLWLPGRCLASL